LERLLLAAPVDSVPQASVKELVVAFIKRHNFMCQKVNEAPWGSYSVAISPDGHRSFVSESHRFGWAFEIEDSAAEILIDVIKGGIDEQFRTFFGPERAEELEKIVV
jgi:hypothetical protein